MLWWRVLRHLIFLCLSNGICSKTWRMFQGVSGRRTDHRKPCSLGIVTFHPRWHTKREAASSDLRIQKALQQTVFSVLGMEPRALHSGQATTVPHPDLTSSKSFSLWRTRPKRLFYQLLLWFLVVWIFHFYFVWPVGGQSLSAGWWKRHIPANWPLVLKTREEAFSSPEHNAACEFPGSAFDWK